MASVQSREKKLQLLGRSVTADNKDSRNNSRVVYIQGIIHSLLFDSLAKSFFFRGHSKPAMQCKASVVLVLHGKTHM